MKIGITRWWDAANGCKGELVGQNPKCSYVTMMCVTVDIVTLKLGLSLDFGGGGVVTLKQ